MPVAAAGGDALPDSANARSAWRTSAALARHACPTMVPLVTTDVVATTLTIITNMLHRRGVRPSMP